MWWTKWRRGRFSPSTSVSPAIHSTKFSILTITRGKYNRPVSGRRAEWTQFGLHPPLCKLKRNYTERPMWSATATDDRRIMNWKGFETNFCCPKMRLCPDIWIEDRKTMKTWVMMSSPFGLDPNLGSLRRWQEYIHSNVTLRFDNNLQPQIIISFFVLFAFHFYCFTFR
jgi:hypothetical protein